MRARGLWPSLLALVFALSPARADQVDDCIRASSEGQRLRNEGKLSAAAGELAVCVGTSCPAMIRRDCEGWVREVESSMPTVIFAATDAQGHDRSQVQVFVDGARLLDRLDGKPVPLDPGAHAVKYVSADGVESTMDLVARVGEKNRVVSMQLALSAPPVSSGSPAPTSSGSEPPPSPPPNDVSPRPTTTRRVPILAWVLGTVSVVGFGAATYFDLSATSDTHTLRATCDPRCAHTDIDAIDTKYRVAGVALGTGLVAAGLTLFLILSSTTAPPPAVSYSRE
jgi:hypothetical protein